MDNAAELERNRPPLPAETVVWELVFTEDYFKTQVRRLRRCRRGIGALAVLNGLCLLILVGLNVLVFAFPDHEPFARVIMPGLLAVLLFAQWVQTRRVVGRWRRSPLLNKRVRFGITAVGVHIVDDLSDGRTQWAAFTRARRFPDGWLLFLGRTLTNWLPDACLILGDAREADATIRTHVADCRDL